MRVTDWINYVFINYLTWDCWHFRYSYKMDVGLNLVCLNYLIISLTFQTSNSSRILIGLLITLFFTAELMLIFDGSAKWIWYINFIESFEGTTLLSLCWDFADLIYVKKFDALILANNFLCYCVYIAEILIKLPICCSFIM